MAYKTIKLNKRQASNLKCDLSMFPNFHKSGSISGMKKLYYGEDALLVMVGDYIYNVDLDTYRKAERLSFT